MKFDEKITAFHDKCLGKKRPLTLEKVRTFSRLQIRIFPQNFFKRNILNILVESMTNDFLLIPYEETANTTTTTDFLLRRYAEAITQHRCHWIRIY